MAAPKGFWGIDIGQCALKALRLEMIDDKPTATAFDYVEHSKILSQPDADPDTLIREALDKFLSRNDVKNDELAVAIAGQSGLARFVKLPPVEEKKIAEIVKFEAKQQIPFPLDEVVWDFQKIAGGEAIDGFALETEIGLFAMKRDVISRYMGYFAGTKTEVHLVQMSPIALVNFATYELLKKDEPKMGDEAEEEENPVPRGKKRCTVVLDVGTDASNLIITDGGKIIWQRPIPLGGNNFTRALTKELKLTFAKAEHLKRNAAKSPDMASILKAIKPVLTDFVGEVQRSLGYFTNTHRDAHVAHLVGLGSAFKLPGLQKYLSDKLSLEVKKPTKFPKLAGDTVLNDPLFQENLLTFPIAYGLALQGLGQARLLTNLLPREIAQDRLIRGKKPFAAAAAALLVLGLAGMSAGYSKPFAALNDPEIKAGMDAADKAGKAFSAQETAFADKVRLSKENQEFVKSIIAGQEERLNWPRFTEVFTAALPKPGPNGNLTEKAAFHNEEDKAKPGPFSQVALWQGSGDAGLRAYDWFLDRMKKGVPVNEALADAKSDMPSALALVNVETVHTRWVNDINAFLLAADKQVLGTFGADIAQYMKDDEREVDPDKPIKEGEQKRYKPKGPAEGGWVVEVRGFTEHNAGAVFVRRALLRNMQRTEFFVRATDAKSDTPENKVAKFIKGAKDPVGKDAAGKPRVSHAFVYNVFGQVRDPQPNTFYNINRGSFLNTVIGNGGAGAGGAGGGLPGTGGGRDDERGAPPAATGMVPPVGMGPPASGTPSSGTPGGADPTATPAAIAPPWSTLSRNSAAYGAAAPGTPPPAPPPLDEKSNRRRYEFVVMFVWREPASAPPAAEPPKQ
jgi:type IV pilus assembly protein PilM